LKIGDFFKWKYYITLFLLFLLINKPLAAKQPGKGCLDLPQLLSSVIFFEGELQF